jgi:hypothetical protein
MSEKNCDICEARFGKAARQSMGIYQTSSIRVVSAVRMGDVLESVDLCLKYKKRDLLQNAEISF